jgi:hypothetical protein
MKKSKNETVVVDAPISKATPAHIALGIAVQTFEVGLIDRKFKQISGKLGENEILTALLEAEGAANAVRQGDEEAMQKTLPETIHVFEQVHKMLNARKLDDRLFEFQEFWDGIDMADLSRAIIFFRQGVLHSIEKIHEVTNPK